MCRTIWKKWELRDAARARNIFDKGADVNGVNIGGVTPLPLALSQNVNMQSKFETVKVLIDRGADVNKRTAEGDTPLFQVLSWIDRYSPETKISILKMLIDKGADVDAKDENGKHRIEVCE